MGASDDTADGAADGATDGTTDGAHWPHDLPHIQHRKVYTKSYKRYMFLFRLCTMSRNNCSLAM